MKQPHNPEDRNEKKIQKNITIYMGAKKLGSEPKKIHIDAKQIPERPLRRTSAAQRTPQTAQFSRRQR